MDKGTILGLFAGVVLAGGIWLACRGCGASGIVALVVLGGVVLFVLATLLTDRVRTVRKT